MTLSSNPVSQVTPVVVPVAPKGDFKEFRVEITLELDEEEYTLTVGYKEIGSAKLAKLLKRAIVTSVGKPTEYVNGKPV